jgi:hypothetical protein
MKTNRRTFFKQLGAIGGSLVLGKAKMLDKLEPKNTLIKIETDSILSEVEKDFKGTLSSVATYVNHWNEK